MNRATQDRLAAALVAVGVALIAFVGIVMLRSAALERGARGEGGETPTFRTARATREAATPGARIGHLEIPRLGIRAAIVEGVDSKSLLDGVGHVPHTPFPGETDNASLAGHRDTHFAPLRGIHRGDSIRVATADGVFLYAVDTAFVVPPTRADLMDRTGKPMLTLITCYPFHWIGPAPKRFVVQAHGLLPAQRARVAARSRRPAARS